jgi:asparagine synthase (glutamine-hydrolysing)
MCGIAGWLGNLPDREMVAKELAEALFHRGPDAYGVWCSPDAALIHTRLSIIDLSESGAQPIANEQGTVWGVFNGEIYNHHELRHNMEMRGHVFKGHSDTEVLPHLYEEYGLGFIDKLRGMFSIAIYDTKTQSLVLARDRFGIKPLFYAVGKEQLSFASEIRALSKVPGVDLRPDRQAIHDFAALLFIPAPETFYVGIRSLQPGEMLVAQLVRNKISWSTQTYHRFMIAPDYGMSLSDAVKRTDTLLTNAVCQQLESEVPLGALLSGGIDSSLVSAAAQAALCGELRTFNVRFPEREYDETWAAVAVAEHIGSRHETLNMLSLAGSWDHVTDLLLHAGQPFADTSIFAVNAICQLMREHVTVVLSGDGGDEAFGGYDFYRWIEWIAPWQSIPEALMRSVLVALQPLSRLGIVSERLPQRIKELSKTDDTSIVENLFCWVRGDEHRRLCLDSNLLPVGRLFEPQWENHLHPHAPRIERLSAITTEANVRLILPNDFLFKVDIASMKESLEVRVPMLDEDLFDFGLSLHHRLKATCRINKRVLRRLDNRELPPKIASKPKRGFGVPVDRWVEPEFKARLRDFLLGPSSKLPEFFRPEIYQPMIEAFCDDRPCPHTSRQGLYQRAIMLLSVELALGENSNGTLRRSG